MVADPAPSLETIGINPTPVWGMTNAERVRRIAAEQNVRPAEGGTQTVILVNLAFAFDPVWIRYLQSRPGVMVTREGVPVIAHVATSDRAAIVEAIHADRSPPADMQIEIVTAEDERGILNEQLRKRERPFAERLVPANVAAIERASYVGAYKGVTDILTKFLWPEWAFQLTRLAARFKISPNQVTAVGTLLCIAATAAFWFGWFWTGLAAGLAFMVLDTVDGKLARCTITSSKLGDFWDHGVDLVHPPFWWWAWATGCAAYGRPLDEATFWAVIAAMLFGYVAQRLIEGAFILRFGMHIHVWERFDSQFRLITARRNPNMILLFACLLVGRPDWGIILVAVWTILSLVVHLIRLFQAMVLKRRGVEIVSWLA